MVRPMRPSDMSRFRELEGEFAWGFGDDLMECLVTVDEHDRAVQFAGAWNRAEVHAVVDKTWGTPGMRLAAFKELHEAMERSLHAKKVGRVVTWMDGMKGFCRRMVSMGWRRTDMESWTRKVG